MRKSNLQYNKNNYYPFGLQHGNYNTPARDYRPVGDAREIEMVDRNPYKYKFNQREYQDELGLNVYALDWYDYGARNYDASLGRWMNVDPLAEEFPEWSPYSFTFNNPLRFVDPDGRAPDDIILRGKNGSSVTFVTDLVDIDVDASSLGVDFGGNYSFEGEDLLVAALDIAGIFDFWLNEKK